RRLEHIVWATASLLSDLRSDRGMEWVPSSAWLTKVAVDSAASGLTYDLAIDPSGAGAPSRVDARLALRGAVWGRRWGGAAGCGSLRADGPERGLRDRPGAAPAGRDLLRRRRRGDLP